LGDSWNRYFTARWPFGNLPTVLLTICLQWCRWWRRYWQYKSLALSWTHLTMHIVRKFGEMWNSGNHGTSFRNSVLISGLRKFRHDTSIVVSCCQLSLIHVKMDAHCDRLDCRMTNYELLRWLVETPSRDAKHYHTFTALRLPGWHYNVTRVTL